MSNNHSSSDNSTWHQMSADEVVQELETDPNTGLVSSEAATRLKEYGYNELEFKKRSALVRSLLQFHSALIHVLLTAALKATPMVWHRSRSQSSIFGTCLYRNHTGPSLRGNLMNKAYVLSNFREDRDELDATIREFECAPDYGFAEFSVAMHHLHHHLNTAWNAQNESTASTATCTEEDFVRWRQFARALYMSP